MSAAAERKILDDATRPADRLGDVVAAHARERQADFPDTPRDRAPIEPPNLS